MSEEGFEWVDWLLFCAVLVLSMCIGVFAAFSGGKQKTTDEVLMGNRNLGLFPVVMSIFMSFVSAILVLGNCAEMYLYGVQWWLMTFGGILGYFFVSHIIVPMFYKLNLTSSFEYLNNRFLTRHTRYMGDFLLILSQTIYMGIATFAPATAMEAATGFPVWASIIVTITVATFYTSIGGMKAVVWTDAVQGLIFLAGIITVLVEGVKKVGGFGEVFRIADEGGRLDLFDFNPNPYGARISFWSTIFGVFVGTLMTMGASQASVQRYCALPTLTKAKLSIVLISPCELTGMTLTCLIGLVVYAYYASTGCDPYRSGLIADSNQLLPRFIMDVVEIDGVLGLFMAVLFSGALSSVSSSLSALSAVTWKDLLEPRFGHLPEARKALITQALAGLYGLAAMAVAFAVRGLGSHVLQASSSLVTASTGPLLGMFFLGFFFPWANGLGTTIGGAVGVIIMTWISIGANIVAPWRSHLDTDISNCSGINDTLPEYEIEQDKDDAFFLYRMSFFYYDAFGATICIIVALIVSFISGAMDPAEQDPQYIIPVFDKLFCCLPEKLRRVLWCSVRHDEVKEEPDDQYDEALEMKIAAEKSVIPFEKAQKQDAESAFPSKDGVYRRFSEPHPSTLNLVDGTTEKGTDNTGFKSDNYM